MIARKLSGHPWTGQSGVVAQSIDCISAPL
jgi:hypothetical protein